VQKAKWCCRSDGGYERGRYTLAGVSSTFVSVWRILHWEEDCVGSEASSCLLAELSSTSLSRPYKRKKMLFFAELCTLAGDAYQSPANHCKCESHMCACATLQ
jgi:hypothetical protein